MEQTGTKEDAVNICQLRSSISEEENICTSLIWIKTFLKQGSIFPVSRFETKRTFLHKEEQRSLVEAAEQ